MNEDDKIKKLNEVREDIYALYPNAKKITVTFDKEKIIVKPDEEYQVIVDVGRE